MENVVIIAYTLPYIIEKASTALRGARPGSEFQARNAICLARSPEYLPMMLQEWEIYEIERALPTKNSFQETTPRILEIPAGGMNPATGIKRY